MVMLILCSVDCGCRWYCVVVIECEMIFVVCVMRVVVIGLGVIGMMIVVVFYEVGCMLVLYGCMLCLGFEFVVVEECFFVLGLVWVDLVEVFYFVDVVFLVVKVIQIVGVVFWFVVLCGLDIVVCILQNGVEQVLMVFLYLFLGMVIFLFVVWFFVQVQEDGLVCLCGEVRLFLLEM